MKSRLLGFELYFDDLGTSKEFYRDVLGLDLVEDKPDHHAKFGCDSVFLCPGSCFTIPKVTMWC